MVLALALFPRYLRAINEEITQEWRPFGLHAGGIDPISWTLLAYQGNQEELSLFGNSFKEDNHPDQSDEAKGEGHWGKPEGIWTHSKALVIRPV